MSTVYKIDTAADEFVLAIEQLHQMVNALQSGDLLYQEHSEVEAWIHSEGMELLRRLFQGHLDVRARQECRLDGLTGADGIERRQARRGCQRGLMTLFGEVQVRRLGYRAKAVSSLYPLDAALNLPEGFYSGCLRKRVCEAASRSSFDEAVADVANATGGKVPKRQALQLVRDISRDFETFYQDRAVVEAPDDEDTDPLVLSVDGKGVVMRPEGLREATRKAAERDSRKAKARLAPGHKPNRKRMATVATVYSVAPHHRTAEQIMGLEARQERPPKARDKRVWASLAREMADIIDEQFTEALRQDPEKRRPWVVLVDGNETQLGLIEAALEKQQITAVVTLDFIHVLEYVWKAAHCFHEPGSDEAEAWVRERALRILQGHSSHVAAGMRRSATFQELPEGARKNVDVCADYLLKYRDYLRYPENLMSGLPIATGVIEGACRHLIKDRMDLTGARWGLPGAEALLKLRSLRSSGDLEAYWAYHKSRAQERNHTVKYADEQMPEAA